MKCINCYREIADNLKFCTYCGTKQPLDREAYEREHPELADALSEEEQQELERQRQIEEAERQRQEAERQRQEAERLAQEEAERKAQEEAMAAQAQAIEEAQSAYNGDNGYVPESEPVAIEDQAPEAQQYQQSTVEYMPQPSSNLIACPDCGHMVSPRAQSCPSCGYPIATIAPPELAPQPTLVDSYTESQEAQETKGGSSGLYALLIVIILILVVLIIAQFQ